LYLECWIETKDIHGFGGTPYILRTLDECKALCINTSTCVAIDWEPINVDAPCWILLTDYTRETIHTGVITHYHLNRDCLS